MAVDIGRLEVTIVDAVQLPVVNHIGKQNPFVVLVVGSERRQTKTSYNGHRSPVWGDRLQFSLERGTSEFVLDVYHESKYGKATLIGTSTISLGRVLNAGSCPMRIRVGEAGEIRLQLSFTPLNRMDSRLSANYDSLAGQAMQNAATSLTSALPQRNSLPSAASNPSAWRTKKPLTGQELEGPSWLTGNSAGRLQTDSTHSSGAVPIESGNRHDSNDSSRKSSLPSDKQAATSPQKSFRSRMGSKINSLWHPKEQPRGSTSDIGSLHGKGSLQYSDQGNEAPTVPPLISEPSDSDAPSINTSGDGEAMPGAASIANSTSGRIPDSRHTGTDRARHSKHSSSEDLPPVAPPRSQWSTQGMRLEPVEAVHIERPTGEAWLNRWEERHEGPDSGMPAFPSRFGRAETASTSGAAPRRQTDGFIGGREAREPSGVMRASDDGSTRVWRSGREILEWGEQRGHLPDFPAFPSTFGSTFPSFQHQPGWSGTTSHERLLSSMQEMTQSVSMQPFGSGPGNVHHGRLGDDGQAQLMDTAMRQPGQSSRPGVVDSVRSISGRAPERFRGPPNGSEAQGRGDGDEVLEVDPRQRSGSAPAATSRPIIPTSFPEPQYNTAQLSERFSNLHSGNSLMTSPALLQSNAKEATSAGAPNLGKELNAANSAPPSSREASRRNPRSHDDTACLTPIAGTQEGEDQTDQQEPPSFVGMVSPFAADTNPLEEESLPSSGQGSHSLPGRGSLTKSAGGTVPMKAVRREMVSEAEASVKVARVDNAVESHASITRLLSDNNQDWLIDEKDLKIAVDESQKPVKLGSGSFGTVYKGVYDDTTEVAIKTLKCETQQDMEDALSEVALLKKQLHPNVVQFLGVSIGDGCIQLVTELMAGNLHTALRNGKYTWHKGGKSVAKNIASALAFLHKKKVVHLDVKSANILLKDNVAKLGDLGLSALMDTNSFVNTLKGMGTLQWTSPEVLLGSHPVTCAADVFSFGTVLWEICTGEQPQRGRLRPVTEEEAPAKISELVWKCLDFDPSVRPTMQEAYNVLKEF